MAVTTLALPDAAATEAAGARLAPWLSGGMSVTLSGELGSGKTTLVRGLLRALGWKGTVKSPTFAVVECYSFSSLYFYHFDFYRFADPDEWESSGFAEYFRDDSVCLIEWPERVAGHLPEPDVALAFALPPAVAASGRLLSITAHSAAGERCRSSMIADSAHGLPSP